MTDPLPKLCRSLDARFHCCTMVALILAASVFIAPTKCSFARAEDKGTAEIHRFQHEQTLRNLRKLGIAMHAYHNDYGPLPLPAMTGKDGKPLLSWRVTLLPYLQEEELYKQFKLDEPWDSDHNKKLLEKMPLIFHPVGVETKEKYATHYQVFVGNGTPFDPPKKITLGDITFGDGTSRTFLIVEAADAVPWTKPADVAFEPGKPLPKMGGSFNDGFHACLCDCSAYFIKSDIADALLRHLITWNDGSNDEVDDFLKKLRGQ